MATLALSAPLDGGSSTFVVVQLLTVAIVGPLLGALLLLRRETTDAIALPFAVTTGFLGAVVLIGSAGAVQGEAIPTLVMLTFGVATCLVVQALLSVGSGPSTGARRSDVRAARAAVVLAVSVAAVPLIVDTAPAADAGRNLLGEFLGEVIAMSTAQWLVSSALLVSAAAFALVGGRLLLLDALDPDQLRVLGHDPRRLGMLRAIVVAVGVTVGSLCCGPLLLIGLATIAPLAARALARSIRSFFVLSAVFGVVSVGVGLWLSEETGLPTGAASVLGATVLLGLAQFGRSRG